MYRFGYGHMTGGFGGPSILSIIVNVLFGLTIAVFVLWVIKILFKHKREDKDEEEEGKDNKYIQILKERYAKGEISKREFDERKKDLM